MTESDREQITQCILVEIEKVRVAIEAQEKDQQAISPDSAIGRISRMDAMYSQQVSIGILHRNRERLSRLEYMLSIAETPEFGLCEFCRDPIPIVRLKAMPDSSTCMRCASFSA